MCITIFAAHDPGSLALPEETIMNISAISAGLTTYSQLSRISQPDQKASSEEASESAAEAAQEASSGQEEGTISSNHVDVRV